MYLRKCCNESIWQKVDLTVLFAKGHLFWIVAHKCIEQQDQCTSRRVGWRLEYHLRFFSFKSFFHKEILFKKKRVGKKKSDFSSCQTTQTTMLRLHCLTSLNAVQRQPKRTALNHDQRQKEHRCCFGKPALNVQAKIISSCYHSRLL